MRYFLLFLLTWPSILLSQDQSNINEIAKIQEILSNFNAAVLEVDSNLVQLTSHDEPLVYFETVHSPSWSEMLSALQDIEIGGNQLDVLHNLPNTSTTVSDPELPECFANWYFTEQELIVDLVGAIYNGDLAEIAKAGAKSAINQNRYQYCIKNI